MNKSRRSFLSDLTMGTVGAVALGATLSSPVNAARFALPGRNGAYTISFRNQHTGERFSGEYRVGDRYLPDAFEEINYIMRDFRADEVFPIDPRLMDVLYYVREKSGKTTDFEILSGYRCPKTNAMLRRSSSGVAQNSLHMTGQAVDFRLPGYSTRRVRNIAQQVRAGGVGYYQKSNFVHVDTGTVRHW